MTEYGFFHYFLAPLPELDSLTKRTEPFALAAISADGLFLARDMLGVKPPCYGKVDGSLAFASEGKALLAVTEDVHEFIAALARPQVRVLHSFVSGVEGAPGVDYGGQMAVCRLRLHQGSAEEKIPEECEEIVMRLHNTAQQRVDRSAQAHGVVPFVPFTDMEVVEYALSIPPEYKVHRGNGAPVEKWILRKAVQDAAPDSVLWRPKAKFWQGSGVKELLSDFAETAVRDADFQRGRNLPNGWKLNSKEELMYYRIFEDHFGELSQLDWMDSTKGAQAH